MDESAILSEIEAAAREAGQILLQAQEIRSRVEAKQGHANFVTEYDRQVQEVLFRRLQALLPEARFIGEEDGADRFQAADQLGYAFCIDPIDGTSNFLTGYRPSVTSIALFRDGTPFLGVVYEPYRDWMFTARKGCGAYRNGVRLQSSEEPLQRSLVSFGTAPYEPGLWEQTFGLCRRYLPLCIDLRRSGSAAWDLCNMALGTTGLYFELRLGLWDYAAAALIAEEAGCTVTDIHGLPLRYDGPSSVICASAGVAGAPYLPEHLFASD